MAFIAKPSWKKKEKNDNFIGKMKILLKKWKILFEIIENFIWNYWNFFWKMEIKVKLK